MRQFLLGVLCVALSACTADAQNIAPWPMKEWPRATPAAQDLDARRLGDLTALIREGERYPDLHSLLVVRRGYLVVEEYFDGWDADQQHTLQSVSKSVTSALVGIALKQGELKGVEESVLGFFPEKKDIANLDERKSSIRLVDLLTMRSGTDYHERGAGAPHHQLNRLSRGWDRFYLDRPMERKPGTYFQYDSGGVILLSSILKARTGLHADGFAQQYLFDPLGIPPQRLRWFCNDEGHPHTGGGLHLRPRDMARFGLLYLRDGRWGDRQVVPAEWVKTSTSRHVDLGRDPTVGYGYLWWILKPDPTGGGKQDIYAAMGFRAQYIFVIPEHQMVVVVTGGTRSRSDQRKPIDFLYTHVLPSVEK